MANFKNFGTILTNQNCVHEEIKLKNCMQQSPTSKDNSPSSIQKILRLL